MDLLTPQSKTHKRAAHLPSPCSEASGRGYSGAQKLLASQAPQAETPARAMSNKAGEFLMLNTIAYVRCVVWQVSCGEDGSSSGGGGFLTPLTAVGATLGKGVSVPPLLTGRGGPGEGIGLLWLCKFWF